MRAVYKAYIPNENCINCFHWAIGDARDGGFDGICIPRGRQTRQDEACDVFMPEAAPPPQRMEG